MRRGAGQLIRWLVVQGKIVRQESANIDANFERKKKQVEIEKKMCVAAGLPSQWCQELIPSLAQLHLEPEQQVPPATP